MLTYPRALSIAGFDGSGGAGILADVKTFLALGCYGMSVLTALTAQNTQGVSDVLPIEPAFVLEQLRLILEDIGVDAIKLGMLHRVAVMEALMPVLKALKSIPIVLDPVMISKGGAPLIQADAIEYLKKYLLPIAFIVTPNCYEAEILADMTIKTPEDQIAAAQKIATQGPKIVVLKGGHVNEVGAVACDYVYGMGKSFFLKAERVATINTHGTGCTFSSAITAGLAKKMPMEDALQTAKDYVSGALKKGSLYQIGNGHGPVHHGFMI